MAIADEASPSRHVLPLLGWLAVLVVGVVAFHRVGDGQLAPPPLTDPAAWRGWAAARDPLVVVAATGRLVVLALAWYLVAATLLGIAARLIRAARLVDLADSITLPVVRGIVQRAFGAGLAVASVVGGPAGVAMADPLPIPVLTEDRVDGSEEGDHAEDRPLPLRLFDGRPQPDDHLPSPTGAAVDDTGSRTHEVVAGDSLWSIAAATLEHAWGRPAADGDVVHYWQEVIAANRDRLVDPGNPDLIFPGQQVLLPPTPSPPE